jgi:hypothetical protein
MCPSGASDPNERTYGQNSWKKAENKDGQPTCEYARLGVVVAGEQYGASFHVCVNRDKCLVHWKDSVKAREKSAAARAKGKTKKAAKVEKKAAVKQESEYERRQREEVAHKAAWEPIAKHVVADAVGQVKAAKALTPQQAKVIQKQHHGELWMREAFEILGPTWFKNLPAALLLSCVTTFRYNGWNTKKGGFQTFIDDVAKPLGLDIKRLEAVRDKHAPKRNRRAARRTRRPMRRRRRRSERRHVLRRVPQRHDRRSGSRLQRYLRRTVRRDPGGPSGGPASPH